MFKLLSVFFVCICSVCICVSAQSASKTTLQRDYGVKLCGREFIRAVIFTCGGSRWKRALDLDLIQSGENDPLGSYPAPLDRDGEVSWLQSSVQYLAKQPFLLSSSSSSSLGSLLQPEEALRVGQHWGSLGTLLPPRPLEGEGLTNPADNRPSPDRRKRNFSLGLAGMCCNQGCTKNDIGRLC